MRLFIKGKDDIDLLPFLQTYISNMMRSYVKSHIDVNVLFNYKEYVGVQNLLNTLFRVNYIRCRKVRYDYIIDINPNIFVSGSFAKLDDICRLINYGNSELPAYPIFTNMFNYVKENFYVLYKYYGRRM